MFQNFKSRSIPILVSLAVAACGIYNRHILFNRMYDVDPWKDQFPILIVLFLAMTAILLFFEKAEMTVIGIKTILLFIFFLQYGPFPEIVIPLFASLFIEIIIMKNSTRGMVIGVLILLFIIGNMTLIRGENWIPYIIPSETILFYLEFTFLACLFTVFFQHRQKDRRKIQEEVQRQSVSINQLTNANLDFQRYVYFIQQESIEKERNRISREIHDSIGYTLTNINMMMEAAIRLINTDHDKMFTLLLRTRHQTDSGLQDMRRAMRELRTLGTELLRGSGGIQSLANTFENATGVKVQVEYGNLSWIFPPEIENVIYRIIQEGMTNAFRHGKASLIHIYFFMEEGFLTISIVDNGSGSTDIQDGIGLTGMRERLNEYSGSLLVQNRSDGFELNAKIPVKEYLHEQENTGLIG